ncbi:MAG: class I SAM-dependent methyltransferase [Candidatus Hydrogenedentes bacterium]|nr:class I SAM-dependent methyltransferase [Candidatus Hydrogenedentota bacterium]
MYDTASLRAYFDTHTGEEWNRLDATLCGRIKYRIHRHFLARCVRPGMRVLDIGCGPGRFAIDLVQAGAKVTLADISPGQLALARKKLAGAGLLNNVFALVETDVCELLFPDAAFDLVVCYGGAVSYAFDRHRDALAELVRVAAPGAPLLLSVMSLYGVMRLAGPCDADSFVEHMEDHLIWDDFPNHPGYVLTRPGSNEFHQPMALFTRDYIVTALRSLGCDVLRTAASNPITALGMPLEKLSANPRAVERLTQWESALCEQPGLVDSGDHLIVVAQKETNS